MIANTQFKDKNSLLFPGQVVTLGIMHPQFDVVEEDHTVSDVDVNYETETKYDNSKSTSYSNVEQAGVKGKNRVTQKIQKVNGETTNIVTANTEQLKAPVKEIVVKGGRQNSYGYDGPGYVELSQHVENGDGQLHVTQYHHHLVIVGEFYMMEQILLVVDMDQIFLRHNLVQL